MKTSNRALYSMSAAMLMGSAQLALAQTSGNTNVGSSELEEVVVVGLRASLEAAAEIKQNADQVVDAIVADDIGKFPDNTVAAALQRVPGVQTVNGWNNEIINPLIRGIGDILTTVDGREMFTGVGRGFAFQDLPAEALSRANVYKSNTANLIEGGVAGVIDLRLHKPLTFEPGTTAVFNARGTYPQEAEEFNYTVGALVSHRRSTEGGEIGFLLDASYSDQNFNRPISFNCDPRSGTNGPSGAAGIVLPTCVGGLNDYGEYERPQVNGSIQWKLNDNWEIYADGLYAGYDATFETDFIFSDIFGAQSITNAQATNDCFRAHVDGAGFLGSDGSPIQDLCYGTSATFNNVAGLTSTQAKTGETDQFMYATGARFDSGALHLGLDLSYVESKNSNRNIIVDIGKQIPVVNIAINNDSHGTTDMPGNPLGDASGFLFANSLFQDINTADSSLFAAAVDGRYDLDGFISQLQFGARYGDRDADYRAIAPGGPGAPGGNRVTLVDSVGLPANFLVRSPASIPFINGGAHWMTPDADYLRNNTDTLRAIYGAPAGDPPFDPSRNFDATEETLAGYLQAKYQTTIGNVEVDGLVGARVTSNDRTVSGTGRIDGVLTPVTTSTSETEVLPNFSARVRLSPDLQLRFTAARTIAQPAFADLNPGEFYDRPTNENIQPNGSGGNPNLKPQKSDAVDATVEYYFARSSYLAAAVYYREIKDRVVRSISPEVIDGVTYNMDRPRNVGEATLQGVELSAQAFFDFLPEGWNGLGAFANYTYADSEIKTEDDPLDGAPLLGVSKNSFNVGLLYEKYGITSRLVYTWRDKFDEFQFGCLLDSQGDQVAYCGNPDAPPAFNKVKAYGRLDMSLGYDFSDAVTVSLEGTNLTGADYYSYFNTTTFPHDIRIDDRTYGVSVRVRL
ncbi:TonB-dependent receptor [Povalibacter sp.]|uniref:TonB-dependent receptor n=1 Tax=Povalibacter sp. TaxID=1962978 RepID=UPI002D1FBE3F|nr:TonB-dependent receptor [Povalibacter sp.]